MEHLPGESSPEVNTDNQPVIDRGRVLGWLSHRAIDSLGRGCLVIFEVVPAVAVPLAWRPVKGQGDAHGGGG